MQISINVKSDGNALVKAAAALANPRPVAEEIAQFGLKHAREKLRGRIQHPSRSTGGLLRGGNARVENNSTAVVGFSALYAEIQQKGGVVRPKGHPYLAIPVPDWLAKSGTWPRSYPKGALEFNPRVQINLLGKTWYGPALVVAKRHYTNVGRGRDQSTFIENGKKTRRKTAEVGEVLYALVRQVKIPARPYLFWDEPQAKYAEAALRHHLGLTSSVK